MLVNFEGGAKVKSATSITIDSNENWLKMNPIFKTVFCKFAYLIQPHQNKLRNKIFI